MQGCRTSREYVEVQCPPGQHSLANLHPCVTDRPPVLWREWREFSVGVMGEQGAARSAEKEAPGKRQGSEWWVTD